MKRPTWFTIPSSLRTPLTSDGVGSLAKASTFSGSGLIPCALTTTTRNLTWFAENVHFLRFSLIPASSKRYNTCLRRWSCSCCGAPKTRMSSIMLTTPSRPSRILLICRSKYSGAEQIPKGSLWKQSSHWCYERSEFLTFF